MNPKLTHILKILGWTVGVVAVVILVLIIFVQTRWDAKIDRPAPALTAPRDSATIARGEYIFKYQAQCWGCHASGTPDAHSAPSGGKPFDLTSAGPGFGIWYTPNITPDVETGIGGWTDGEILQAIREGVRKDRTALFPLMPVDSYYGISDADALAIVAYLRSIPPVSNHVPTHEPSFFAKALFAFSVLKPKNPITEAISAPPPGPTVEYGKYVASNLAGCMDCHTPRNLQSAEFYLDSLGTGSTIAFGEAEGDPITFYATNITPDKETGIGNWSERQFAAALTAGMRPDSTVLSPHMPYPYFKSLSQDDLRAIFLYLKELPSIKRTAPKPGYSAAFMESHGVDRGELLFKARCQSCHGPSGTGAQPTEVKLAEVAPSLSDNDLKEFIRTGDIELKMPAFGKTLLDGELDDLVAFIRSWEKM